MERSEHLNECAFCFISLQPTVARFSVLLSPPFEQTAAISIKQIRSAPTMVPERIDEAISVGDTLDIENYVPYFLRAISNKLTQAAMRAYGKEFGIGMNEWTCLALLAREPNVSATRICEVSGFDKAVISRSVNSLEKRGFIEMTAVPEHYRKRHIHLTHEGIKVYRALKAMAEQREMRILKGISPQDRDKLLSYLRIIHKNATLLLTSE